MKHVVFTIIAAIAVVFFIARGSARPSPAETPAAAADLTRALASQQAALSSLQAKVDRLASLLDGVAAKMPGPETRSGAAASQAAESLESKLSGLSTRIDSLVRQLARVSAYSDQIDRSLVGIDTKTSTPAVLSHRLDRLQKASKPQ